MPSLAINVRILRAAVSADLDHAFGWAVASAGLVHALVLLLLVVADRGLDGVLGEHRAVNLHRRQAQLGDDVGVLDGERFLDRLALQPLGGEARAGDRRAAAERLELRVVDDAGLGIDLDLQLHDVAALRRADQPGPDVRIALSAASRRCAGSCSGRSPCSSKPCVIFLSANPRPI